MKQLTNIQKEQVAAYIKGELNHPMLADFEAALDKNEQLQDEVMFQRKLLSALNLAMTKATVKQAKIENLLKDKTLHPQSEAIDRAIQQAHSINNRQREIRYWLVTGLAAACVLLISIFGLRQYTMNEQYAKIEHAIEDWQVNFNIHDPGYESVSGTDDFEENIQIAKKQYEAGKLEDVLTTLNLISEDELPDYILLAKGQIHTQLKNYKEANRLLRLATASDEVIVKDEAYLSLGMVYFRMGKKKKAKEQLKEISTAFTKKEANRIIQTYF